MAQILGSPYAVVGLFDGGAHAQFHSNVSNPSQRRYAEWYPDWRQAPPGAPEQLKQIPLGRLGRRTLPTPACALAPLSVLAAWVRRP